MHPGSRRASLESIEMLGYVSLATIAQWALTGPLGPQKSFTAFFASTLLASYRCDWPFAVVAALLGYAIGQRWLSPIGTPASDGFVALGYGLISALVIGCSQHLRTARAAEERRSRERLAEQTRQYAAEIEARCTAVARDADRLKTDFLKTMSHELRTPMNAIMGFTDLLTDGHAGQLNPAQREYVQTVHDSAIELLRVVDTVLEAANLLSGRTTASPALVDPVETIELALREVEPKAHAKQLALVGPNGPIEPMTTDGRKLKYIVSLLLDNAVKFTPHGRIEVSASKQGRMLVIEVRDTGVGIPEADRSHIFELFRQGSEGLTRQHGGTGTGLFLAQGLARLLGGDLEAAPSQQGARFVLRVPDTASAEAYRQPPAVEEGRARRTLQPSPPRCDRDDASKPAC